jgi:hypothetical protein
MGVAGLMLLAQAPLRTRSVLQKRQEKLLRSSCAKNSGIRPLDAIAPLAEATRSASYELDHTPRPEGV